jgi:hypothetical protein
MKKITTLLVLLVVVFRLVLGGCPPPCVDIAIELPIGGANVGKTACGPMYCGYESPPRFIFAEVHFKDPFLENYPDLLTGTFLYGNAL